MTKNISRGITIVGLGPAKKEHLTLEASLWIDQLSEIWVRTEQHPVVDTFSSSLKIQSFDSYYQTYDQFEEVYRQIVQKVIELGSREEGVTYAVPGHPMVAEATTPEIIRLASQKGIPVRIIEGISFLEPVFTELKLDPIPQLTLMDALELGLRNYPPISPASPMLIAQIYSKMIANEVKLTLSSVFPDEHLVKLVHDAGTAQCLVQSLPLYEIDRQDQIGLRTVLYVPPLGEETSFEAFQEVVARLRAPDGCPWDRKQTHSTLKRYLLEETYELLDALDREAPAAIAEELGDLLLQILLHAQIGLEEGEFNMVDVLSGIHEKIVRRHPHIFADARVEDEAGVIAVWEQIKAREREDKGETERSAGMLEGIPRSLPALSQAQEVQTRAARVGFDWDDVSPVYEKIEEELLEVRQAESSDQIQAEIGDLLFAVVNLARWLGVDAETALRTTSARFRRRFQFIEKQAALTGKRLDQMTLAEMDRFWDEAKRNE